MTAQSTQALATIRRERAAMVDTLRAMIAACESDRAALVESTGPKVTNGHSDGRRVKYVRAETAEATLRAVLAMLEGAE